MANLRWTPLLACSIAGAGICSLLLNSVTNAIYMNNFSLSTIHKFSVTGLLTDFTIQPPSHCEANIPGVGIDSQTVSPARKERSVA